MSVPRAVVCLPTYNERENLEKMIRALAHQDVDVLVIDDSSPDGTGEIADRLASELPWVEVLHRPRKEGLDARTPTGSGTCSQRAPSSCSRWTATSRTTRRTCRG